MILCVMAVRSTARAGTLSCSITTAAACTNPAVVILRMASSTNTHAELSTQTTAGYANNVVCCTAVSGLGNTCGGTFATALKLSSVTNAQVQQNTGSYANNACISVSSGSVTIGYQPTNCSGFDTTLASMASTSNSHIGSPTDYVNKVCGTASGTSQSLTFTLGSNTVNLSALSATAPVTSTHTLNVGTNASSGVTVTVQGSTLTSGSNTIAACTTGCMSSNSSNQFGINLVANTTPSVGSNPTGSAPIGTAATNYATANTFRFAAGEIVANSSGAINDTTYTVSYLANISALQPAGNYVAAVQYIATANF